MEGVSSAAVEVLVQNLINVIKDEYFLRRDLHKEAQQLHKTLGMIQAYLNDAEKKSIDQDAVKIWLRELEALAFDADNVFDEFTYHLLRKQVKKMDAPTCKDKVLSCFSSFNYVATSRNTALKIKHINESFESMNKRATELSLQSMIVNASPAVHASFETDSFTADPIFIGRDDDVDRLVGMVEESPHERNLSILAIVGMGGLGKTTLTRKIFNHEKMKTRFGSLVWVHVSQTFDPITLLKKILKGFGSQCGEDESRQDVMKKLQEALKDKTYLVVLDDVWNEDVSKWDDFMNSVSGVTSTQGNAIIITTRSTQVASTVNPLQIHSLKGLSEDECWSIIKAKAFENGQVPASGFETIGRKIARRCQGLPLAANVVGGVLRRKSEEEWLSIERKWLPDAEGNSISRILRLSYDNLVSSSLKKCFAYLSVFPKGKYFKKQEVIEMWIAEGFLDGRNEDMECLGDMYFNILVRNSILQVAPRKDGYGMHDLVHDLAFSTLGSSISTNGISLVRYIFLDGRSPAVPKEVAKYLRTFVLEGGISSIVFSGFECLHVLILHSYDVKELPSSIRKLIHLRSLNISTTSIKELPEWIGELHHLQTLRACKFDLKKLPSTVKYLINLRHLYLWPYIVELPAEIGRLTNLQTLKQFRVGNKKGYKIEELGSLKNLKGKLEIYNLEMVCDKKEAEKAKIFQKKNILKLSFSWNADREGDKNDAHESVLEGLRPHPNIKKLEIDGFGSKRFPLWTEKMEVRDGPHGPLVGLDKLTKIILRDCGECVEVPKLDHLSSLKYLFLSGMKKVRFINSSFTSLTSLLLADLEVLECLPDWLFNNNPDLSNLYIYKCPQLRELPDGLHALVYLQYLTIENCPNLKSITSNNDNNEPWKSQGRRLLIRGCRGLIELPRGMIESWAPSLESLSLEELSSLDNLPMLLDCLAESPTPLRLIELTISGVPKFMASHPSVESGWDLGSLWMLKIFVSGEKFSSIGVKETMDGILRGCSCDSLGHLEIQGIEDWESIPEPIQHLTGLYQLKLENFGVQELPRWLGNLSRLYQLNLTSCKNLRRLLPIENALTKLLSLEIKDCPELEIGSEWYNLPGRLRIQVDGRQIK